MVAIKLGIGGDCFFIERSFQYLVLVTSCVSVGKVLDSEIYRITGTTFISLSGNSADDDKVSGTLVFSISSSPSC